jgi:hypothetical protein
VARATGGRTAGERRATLPFGHDNCKLVLHRHERAAGGVRGMSALQVMFFAGIVRSSVLTLFGVTEDQMDKPKRGERAAIGRLPVRTRLGCS